MYILCNFGCREQIECSLTVFFKVQVVRCVNGCNTQYLNKCVNVNCRSLHEKKCEHINLKNKAEHDGDKDASKYV